MPQGPAMSQTSPRSNPLPSHWRDAEHLLFHFDQAWQGGPPPRMEDYLERWQSGGKAGEFRKLIEELVKIDLEYRWRRKYPAGSGDSGPRLESYIGRFPQLGPPNELSLGLIGDEYLVRQLWGDRPRPAEYVGRFPRQGTALLTALAKIDAEIAADVRLPGEPTPLDWPARLERKDRTSRLPRSPPWFRRWPGRTS